MGTRNKWESNPCLKYLCQKKHSKLLKNPVLFVPYYINAICKDSVQFALVVLYLGTGVKQGDNCLFVLHI